MNESPPVDTFEFGPFCFDAATRLLLRKGVSVTLTPKAAEALWWLLARRGRVVTKDDLMQALWPDRFVEEANLTQTIYALRKSLGDSRRPQYIETLPRRGYRFVGAVKVVTHDTQRPARTLAVLPFRPLTPGQRDEAMELGIADALITSIGNSGLLTVRPLAASRRYVEMHDDPGVAARELAVDAVLDGTLQRSGGIVRVTARLLRASDASTLWAGRFHESATNPFAVQDAIAEKIAAALKINLGGDGKARLHKRYTHNAEAYQLYVNGRYNAAKATEEGFRKAIDFFHQTIAVDPQCALAYVGIAEAYTALDWYGALSTRDSNPQAWTAAEQALAIDPELAEAHAAAALARQYRWDWTGAEAAFRRAIELNPSYASARQWFGLHLAFRGQFDAADAEFKRARELDPMSLTIRAQHALVLYFARRYDEAVQQCRAALQVEPGLDEARIYLALSLIELTMPDAAVVELQRTALLSTPDVQAMLARALAAAGRRTEAQVLVEKLTAVSAAGYVPHFWIAAAHVALADTDAALRRLEAAYHDPDDSCAGMAVAPFFDPLRADRRFQALLSRMALAA